MDTFGSYGQYFRVLDKSEFIENNGLLIMSCTISKILMALLLAFAAYYCFVDWHFLSAVWCIAGFFVAVLVNDMLFKLAVKRLVKTFHEVYRQTDESIICAIAGHGVEIKYFSSSDKYFPHGTVVRLDYHRSLNHSIVLQSNVNVVRSLTMKYVDRDYFVDDMCRKFNMYVSDGHALSEWYFTENSLKEFLRVLNRCTATDNLKAVIMMKQHSMSVMYASDDRLLGCRITAFDYKEVIQQKFDYVNNAITIARALATFSDFKETQVVFEDELEEQPQKPIEEKPKVNTQSSKPQDKSKNKSKNKSKDKPKGKSNDSSDGKYRPSPEFLNHQWKSSFDFKNGHRF